MLDFSQVWYLGLDAKKIEAAQGAAQNNGYDDESGSYIKVCESGSYIKVCESGSYIKVCVMRVGLTSRFV